MLLWRERPRAAMIPAAMGHDGVLTFRATPGGATLLARHATLAASSATLPPGAYTTLRTYRGRRVLRLDRHFDRLEETARLQGQPGAVDRPAARAAITAALDAGAAPESRLRLTLAPPEVYVAQEAFRPPSSAAYASGVACVTVDLVRDNPHAKDTRFIATAQHLYGRLPAGVEEALLVAPDAAVLEGLSSNFFAVLEGRLRTEDARVLHGITRELVLEVAARVLPVELRAVSRRDLAAVQEAFLTSVSREVLPVVRIDGRPVGDGAVGPIARQVASGFAALVEAEAEPL